MTIHRYSNVTYTMWPELHSAINDMIAQGTYKKLAEIHAATESESDGLVRARHRMHGANYGPIGMRRFLPWHRAYLIAFERELRNINEYLSLPYWDWHADAGRLVGFSGLLGLSTGRELGTRLGEAERPQRRPWLESSSTIFNDYTEYTGSYYQFTRALEFGPHGWGHMWIGGVMSDTMNSPNDPAFWFHHAQVDRIWAKWQIVNPNERAALTDPETILDPWNKEFTVLNVDDISNLGGDSYTYIDP